MRENRGKKAKPGSLAFLVLGVYFAAHKYLYQ